MRNQKFVSVVLSVTLSFLGVAVIAYGATTIGTAITTSGNLSVTGTGLTTLVNASTTIVEASNYMAVNGMATTSSTGNILTKGTLGVTGLTTLVNASTTRVSISGGLWVNGNATTTSAGAISTQSDLAVLGNSTLTGTLGVTGKTTLVNASTTRVTVSTGLWINGNATTTSEGVIVLKNAAADPTCSEGGLIYNSKGLLCLCAGGDWELATSTTGGDCTY